MEERANVMALSKTQMWIVTTIVMVMALVNGWAVMFYVKSAEREQKQEERITVVEKEVCTKEELKQIVVEVVDARFDRFELMLQQKYKITNK
jgi:flagellar basal body-associated protein FliL